MRIILVAGALVTCMTSAATGLDCYLCLGSATGDCSGRDNATMMIQHCAVYEHSRNYCVSYKSVDNAEMTAGFIRGCGFMKAKDKRTVCEYLMELKMADSCDDCETSLCNI